MTMLALLESFATLFVACDESSRLPIKTELNFVFEEVGPTTKVLIVVGIDALSFIMVVVERTPLGLEVKHEEVEVILLRWKKEMKQADFDVFHRVGEGAIISILAEVNLVGVEVTKLSFVFVLVIETFDSVVGAFALVPLWTPLRLSELAKLWCVKAIVPTPVFYRMVEKARLVVVRNNFPRAFVSLEIIEHKVADNYLLARLVVDFRTEVKKLDAVR